MQFQRKWSNCPVNFPVLYCTSGVSLCLQSLHRAPGVWNLLGCEESHSTWLHRLWTAQLPRVPISLWWEMDPYCTVCPMQPYAAALSERLENFPDERTLPLVSIYSAWGGFPCGLAGKESTGNVGDLGSIPGLGRSPGEGKGHPFQYSGLENSMDFIVHGVAKSRTWLRDFHFTFTGYETLF